MRQICKQNWPCLLLWLLTKIPRSFIFARGCLFRFHCTPDITCLRLWLSGNISEALWPQNQKVEANWGTWVAPQVRIQLPISISFWAPLFCHWKASQTDPLPLRLWVNETKTHCLKSLVSCLCCSFQTQRRRFQGSTLWALWAVFRRGTWLREAGACWTLNLGEPAAHRFFCIRTCYFIYI
jgi:hypothetical protein